MVLFIRKVKYCCHPIIRLLLLPWKYLRVTVSVVLMLSPLLYFINLDDIYVELVGEVNNEFLDYISKTASCKLPNLNPHHESILPFMKNLQPLECGVASASFENNVLRFEGLNVISVHYRTIKRPDFDDNRVNVSEPIELPNLLANPIANGAKTKHEIEPG